MRISRRRLFLGAAASTAARAMQVPSGTRQPVAATGRRFTGASLAEVAFPLGGIGTGTVSLGGFGNLRDWEIFNRPNKGGVLPFTFAALRLAGGSLSKPLIRVVERQAARRIPFLEAQKEVREKIQQEWIHDRVHDYLERIKKQFPVWTIFDAANKSATAAAAETSRY